MINKPLTRETNAVNELERTTDINHWDQHLTDNKGYVREPGSTNENVIHHLAEHSSHCFSLHFTIMI